MNARLPPASPGPVPGLSNRHTFALSLGAVVAFHLAYSFPFCGFLMAVYLYCLFELARLNSGRQASYVALAISLLTFGPQLAFFWRIFGTAAIALWMVLAFWITLFLALARLCRQRLHPVVAALVIPFLWTGLEYFRSELYYLRFSWLNVGYAFAGRLGWLALPQLGVYGIGFVLMAAICLLSLILLKTRLPAGLGLLALCAFLPLMPTRTARTADKTGRGLAIAGVQLEFPGLPEVLANLDQLAKKYPHTELFVLSEYTFDGPAPEGIKAWCRRHQRYLVVGAKDPVSDSQFFNTAFVIGPQGDIVFRQAKCVPVQFFKDGLPARAQQLWESPWGKIGICICYDLSYRRVTDRLVQMGAQALIVPTMDVVDWGSHQHKLHARVAQIRAAEYGIPIFRLASSGISQYVDSAGRNVCTAPFAGEAAILAGTLDLSHAGRLPWDRVIAPISVVVTGLTIAWFAALALKQKIGRHLKPN
jgi:apolipoprotein N-acyltransferase